MGSGERDEAVQHLLAAKGEDLTGHSKSRVFRVSEDDFKGLSREQQRLFHEEVNSVVPNLKELGIHCLALGDQALERGDADEARRCFEAVNRLGRTLKAPQRMVVLHSLGEYYTIDLESLKVC